MKQQCNIKKISIDNILIGIYLLIAPLDYALLLPAMDFTIINTVGFAILVLKLIKFAGSGFPFKNASKTLAVFYVYMLLNMLISMFFGASFDILFTVFGLLAILCISDKYDKNVLIYFKKCLFISCILLTVVGISTMNFSSWSRLELVNFARYVDPNRLTSGFVLCTAFLTYAILNKQNTSLSVILLVLIFFIILMSGSRGGLFSNILVIAILLLASKKSKTIFYFIMVSAIVFVLYFMILPNNLFQRLSVESMISSGGSGRTAIWSNYMRIYFNADIFQMLFGFGRGNASSVYLAAYGVEYVPHMSFINVLISGGLIGLILFLFLLGRSLQLCVKYKQWFALSLLAGLIVAGLTLDMEVSRDFWLFISVVHILLLKKRKEMRCFSEQLKLSATLDEIRVFCN
ncbi:MAG: O-antigen ligase family protein [Firmicutes bacterium]|nr:O-antigen ligase family protein [Bacillota bacterium]